MKTTLAVLAFFATAVLAEAQTLYYADLAGNQEVPPNSSPGYGESDLSLSGTTLTVTDGSYNDLLGNSSTIRLADAAPGMNGVTIAVLTLTSPGTTSGTFSGSTTLTTQQISDLAAGNLYLNLTTTVYPSGEIRGQLELVPEPSTLALAGLGSLAVLALRQRKAKG